MVSFDAVWETCSRCSYIGVAFVVEANIGVVADKKALSTSCLNDCADKQTPSPLRCLRNGNVLPRINVPELTQDKQAALNLDTLDIGFLYIKFIGDGDSFAFKTNNEIYGNGNLK